MEGKVWSWATHQQKVTGLVYSPGRAPGASVASALRAVSGIHVDHLDLPIGMIDPILENGTAPNVNLNELSTFFGVE
jgi:hypothetical protein